MKKILVISYFFAPNNDAGSNRTVQFVKRLPQLGYCPIVITVDEDSVRSNGGSIDKDMLIGIPKEVEIVFHPDHQLQRKKLIKYRLYRLAWILRFKKFIDVYREWSDSILPIAEEKIKSSSVDLIYVSSAPISSVLDALKLSKRSKKPLVVDFRDPYSDAYGTIFPTWFHWKYSRIIEKKIFKHSAKIIVNTEAVKALYIERYPWIASKITVITNGY